MYKRERSLRETTATANTTPPPTMPQRRKTPSFSSSLLESIYRSIDDESGGHHHHDSLFSDASHIKKQSTHKTKHGRPSSSSSFSSWQRESSNLQRAMMIEEWMEKQQSSRNSSDSSSGGTFSTYSTFSSSETESSTHHRARSRTLEPSQKTTPHNGGKFSRTKLSALKIYSELKKAKQPISPGAKLTNFLTSIFNSGNVKKAKMCYVGAVDDVSFERKPKSSASTSASSLSRSCMSKTTTTTTSARHGNNNNNNSRSKRSVRFYPVSVILGEDGHGAEDEDLRPCGHGGGGRRVASLAGPLSLPTVEEVIMRSSNNRSTTSTCGSQSQKKRDYVGSYQKQHVSARDDRDEEEDGDGDVESCASSDLFELDHLIGVGRYREELPVYETTSLKRNQAIANGFIL